MPFLKATETKTVEKLFKVSQYRHIIELFKFFGWATTPLCENLDLSKPKTEQSCIKSRKINIVVNFLIFPVGRGPP